ncbi:ig domain-containing protein [Trichonephila clavipes]|nr:ig domain-containing protein [Trichonephila clavipes]
MSAEVEEKLLIREVAWIHTQRYTLLTLQNRVITRNSRYKVTHNSHRTWWLHIADVQERDRGEYMCQINTSPMKSQTGFIEVVDRPPNRDICSCTSASNGHVYYDGHSSSWTSWIVVPLSLSLKFEDYLTLGIPLR